jgi:DNA-binding transcriptional regulator YhcF (GntR family)
MRIMSHMNMGFNTLKDMGFVEKVNNMGTIIYERNHMTFVETLVFHSYTQHYEYYGKREGKMGVLSISDSFHKVIDDIIKKELYWK